MSLLPPRGEVVGQVWVDPITGHRFVFTGENLDEVNYGWVPWDLWNEEYEYKRGENGSTPEENDDTRI